MKATTTALPLMALLAMSIASANLQAQPDKAREHALLLEQEKAVTNIYKVHFPNQKIARKAAISFHEQLLESHYEDGYLVMQLEPEEMKKLEVFGFTFSPATEFMQKRNEVLDQLQQRAQLAAAGDATIAAKPGITGIPGYSCYETVEETFAAAEAMAAEHPDLAEWIDVGDSWEKSQGLGGYDIKVLKLTNKATGGDKPKLFANSAIHAREYTTAPLNLAFARWLIDGYGKNADATWILDHHEVHLMLHTNPDGRKKAESGLSWRKNTNQNYCGATSNTRGADLNRNFTFGWNSTNGEGSSGDECNLTYRGPSAGSEPEIQAIENYVRSIWPDRRGPNRGDAAPADTSGIHLDIHSYSRLVLWPWGDTTEPAPNATALQTLGRKFAFFNGYSPEQSVGLYPTDGTSDGVSYGELGVAAYTFELGTQFFQSCSTYEKTIKPDNLPALIYAAKVVRTPYLTPAGPDVTTVAVSAEGPVAAGETVTLTAQVTDSRFNNSNGTEPTQNIAAAEYYIDKAPWEDGAMPVAMAAQDGSFDAKTETVDASIDTTGMTEGKHLVYVRSRDADGNWGAVSAVFLEVGAGGGPVEYCAAGSSNADSEWIANVSVGGLSNSSGASRYSDFTSQTAALQRGTNALRLTPQFSGRAYGEYWKVWIDLNQDGDFSDQGEQVFSSARASSTVVTGNLVVPANATKGKTRMRVAMRYNNAPAACGTFNYGEVEDYSVTIQ
ncbi:M14 family zinc carboxypeptidase [Pseudomonas indica]|uniref:Zinc carboxypeptidase n=1 Tax=Pseudomonas indica TaxID=137658 RepID=A0A1G9A6J9_9PSED|nr:M14 family zinc carboxypeptidase [Pseudomonas indica]PAU59115.1 carboxypeptidase [Pseudomonas indica]SDK23002.1 Zinc carboxypeptidase [Pseudomonas indica]